LWRMLQCEARHAFGVIMAFRRDCRISYHTARKKHGIAPEQPGMQLSFISARYF
ncbi:hypothetical protein RvY_03067, partial [Ramazzottius varieornatus]